MIIEKPMEKFTRRNFLTTATKFLAGAAVFGFMPNLAEAAEKVIYLEEKPLSAIDFTKEVLPFDIPQISKFQTLSELNIPAPKLNFVGTMDQRRLTTAIVLHHAGLKQDKDSTLKEIHKMHLGNGWSGVGYHFLVHKNGAIEHARPLDRVGAHAYRHNGYSVGICMTGNFEIGVPPTEQILATEKLIAALCQHYDINPSMTTIFGHRDLCDTDCPGYNVYPRLSEIIGNVKAIL